jgi:hypothetical protein
MQKRLLEALSGRGTVTATSGKQAAVQYMLLIYQEETPVRVLCGQSAQTNEQTNYEGVVRPVCFFVDNGLTLEMQDGRKLKFAFTHNIRGTIAVSEWIG